MTGEIVLGEELAAEAALAAPAIVTVRDRRGLFLFGGLLMLLAGLGDPTMGLPNVPVAFFLENRLHLTANALAVFKLWTSIPLFLSFVFGFTRDRWSPFGRGDQGHLILFGLLTAAAFVVMAFLPITYGAWACGLLATTALFQMVNGAGAGLMSSIGQQNAMAGRMSVLLSVCASVPILLASIAGGLLSDYLERQSPSAAARAVWRWSPWPAPRPCSMRPTAAARSTTSWPTSSGC